jgi:flagellar biosynthesis GTPase FlhF
MKNILILFFSVITLSVVAQDAPVYDDMIFESDSMAKAYKPLGKNYVIVKSKRGTDGVPKSSSADSIRNMNITDIVLVFTENEAADLATRPVANRERWENLIKTYPEFFKENPNLFNTCQCVIGGDAEALKKSQGFYIYIGGKPEAAVPETKPVAKKEEKAKEEKPKKEEKAKEEKPKKEEKVKEEKVAKKEEPKEEKIKEEKPKKEKKVKEEKPKEEVTKKEEPKEEPVVEPVVAKAKKQGYAAPKKAKDAKVCRPPCYDGGDEGLNNFLKDAIPLSKKQKRHSGDLEATVTLMLHFDGSIKKTMILCQDEEFKKQVEEAIKLMDLWNPAVKGGVTIKSQVKMVLKYDNGSKQIKPYDINIIPRPAPKCTECLDDSQVFPQ